MAHVRTPSPVLRGPLPARILACVVGCAAFGWGIAAMIASAAGVAPWDVFHFGLADLTGTTFGVAGALIGLVVGAVAWLLGRAPGWATLVNIVVITPAADLFLRLHLVPDLAGRPLALRLTENALGIAVIGLGSGLYIGAGRSAGPRDSLMLALSDVTGIRVALSRNGQELAALAAGIALGGAADGRLGIGTLLFAFTIGPAVEAGFWLVNRSPLALRPLLEPA
jgi:uncharacterized membrane protein YczE